MEIKLGEVTFSFVIGRSSDGTPTSSGNKKADHALSISGRVVEKEGHCPPL
jgi:hypothetical protein